MFWHLAATIERIQLALLSVQLGGCWQHSLSKQTKEQQSTRGCSIEAAKWVFARFRTAMQTKTKLEIEMETEMTETRLEKSLTKQTNGTIFKKERKKESKPLEKHVNSLLGGQVQFRYQSNTIPSNGSTSSEMQTSPACGAKCVRSSSSKISVSGLSTIVERPSRLWSIIRK